MIALFGPVKIDPERKISVAKTAEKQSLLMPALVGVALIGGAYACVSNATRQFAWWGFAGASGAGAIACVLSRAIANQPGSSETLRSILISTDKMAEVAASLDESMRTTHVKLDRQQEGLARTGQSIARLNSSLDQSAIAIDQFSQGLYQMATGHRPEVPVQAYQYEVPHQQQVEYQSEPEPVTTQPASSLAQELQFSDDEW